MPALWKKMRKKGSPLSTLKECSLLGVTRSGEMMLRTVTGNEEGKLANLAQGSAQILTVSRLVFYSHILYFLRVFCPRKAAICYKDSERLLGGV